MLFTHLLCLCRIVGIVLCMFANLSLLSYRHFKERLPEAICCCLQTCNVDVVLVMYCMYMPAFIVTSADISQLSVYLCYLLIYCLLLCTNLLCLWNVGDIVLHVYTFSCSLVLTSASYRYI